MQDRQREFTIDFSDFQGSYLIYMEEHLLIIRIVIENFLSFHLQFNLKLLLSHIIKLKYEYSSLEHIHRFMKYLNDQALFGHLLKLLDIEK
ncbi:unnamed protein product [Paramecium pentaurelia]|uniref:Uncharacterized protein n=1 Tax=Paramecium pentaurelia TaxID=43138 RepID=A0A8S1YI44_9CILI|nr:unnamed protein product [Paramecium pentaurelia]